MNKLFFNYSNLIKLKYIFTINLLRNHHIIKIIQLLKSYFYLNLIIKNINLQLFILILRIIFYKLINYINIKMIYHIVKYCIKEINKYLKFDNMN